MRAPFIGQVEPAALTDAFLAHPPQGGCAERLVDGTLAFTLPFDLLTTAAPAVRQRLARWPLQGLWRRWLRPHTRFIGSTVTEYAWLPPLDPDALACGLRDSQSRLCRLLVIKDIPCASPLLDAAQNAWAGSFAAACRKAGFVLLEGQALAWLPIDFDTPETYIARLSRGRRRDLRRKLRSRARLQVDVVPTGIAFVEDAFVDRLYALYANVHAQSDVHFDFLERPFFAALLRDAQAGGVVFLYRHEGTLIGWNLCYEYGDALVDKYMGLRYPEAREHDLYAVSWMENLSYACQRGLQRYIAGWTDPEVKAHLGARFTFTRHAVYLRSGVLRFALRRLVHYFEADRAWHEAKQCAR